MGQNTKVYPGIPVDKDNLVPAVRLRSPPGWALVNPLRHSRRDPVGSGAVRDRACRQRNDAGSNVSCGVPALPGGRRARHPERDTSDHAPEYPRIKAGLRPAGYWVNLNCYRSEGWTSTKRARIIGSPDMGTVSTSIAERANLEIRSRVRRFTRLTNGHSKKAANHAHAFSLYALACNFCRPHGALSKEFGIKTTPAMVVAELEPFPWTILDVVKRMDADRKVFD